MKNSTQTTSASDLYPSQLRELCQALGWQGGTYWQVLEKVRRLQLASTWFPISTAPLDGTRVLLHPAIEHHDPCSKGYWSAEHKCWIIGGSPSGVQHTHWMILPDIKNQ